MESFYIVATAKFGRRRDTRESREEIFLFLTVETSASWCSVPINCGPTMQTVLSSGIQVNW